MYIHTYTYLYRSFLRQSSAPAQRGEGDLKAGGGCEGQVAGYFLLSCVAKNMKLRKNLLANREHSRNCMELMICVYNLLEKDCKSEPKGTKGNQGEPKGKQKVTKVNQKEPRGANKN